MLQTTILLQTAIFARANRPRLINNLGYFESSVLPSKHKNVFVRFRWYYQGFCEMLFKINQSLRN